MAMDPFLSVVSSVASQSLDVTKTPALPVDSASAGNSDFKQMMDQMGSQEDLAASLGISPSDLQSGGESFQVISAEGITPAAENLSAMGNSSGGGTDKVVQLLQELNTGQNKADNLLNDMLYSGKKFSNQELLAIQARIFQFVQLNELAVKTASEGVSSIKTVLNAQVQ